MSTLIRSAALCLSALLVAACGAPPRPWLRYELAGKTDWGALGPGRYGGTLNGAEVSVYLYDQDTRVLAVVENRTEDSMQVSVGPDTGKPDAVIGEVLLRQIDGPAAGGPGMVPFNPTSPVALDGGWRATFYVDRPLGRDIKLGQYFVLATEIVNSQGERARGLLPVVGKRGGVPRDRQR